MENMLQGKKNMAAMWETIISRFLATTFLTRPEGIDTGSGAGGRMEGEKDGGGKREIMSESVLVILIKWKCFLSSSYWFLPGAVCVLCAFQREKSAVMQVWRQYFSLVDDVTIAASYSDSH